MRPMLRHKMIGLPVLAAILPVLVMLVFTFVEKNSVNSKIEGELVSLACDSMKAIAVAMRDACKVTGDMIQKDVDRRLHDAEAFFSALGGFFLDQERVSWNVVNQFTGEKAAVSLPKVLIGGVNWLGQNDDPGEGTPFPGLAKIKFGGDYAVFQRMNEQGDMMQVATTLSTPEGRRAIGSYIPAETHDDQAPVVSTVLQGKPFRGLACVGNRWYISYFNPIMDKSGAVIGMLFAGIPNCIPDSLRQAVEGMKVGKTGYVYIVGGKLPYHQGRYIISKDGRRDGENIWDSQDSQGRYYIRSIVNKALALKDNEVAFERYPWRNEGETADRWKMAAIAYFEPWDWVIGVGAYEDDYFETRQNVASSMSHMLWVMAMGGLAVLIPIVGVALFLGNRMTNRLLQGASISRMIAGGDLSSASEAVKAIEMVDDGTGGPAAGDEIAFLLDAIKTMTENLNDLVGQVQRSGIQVTSSSTELAATAREQETTMASQVASTRRMAASVEEISEVAARLVETMEQVAAKSQETAGFASKGQTDLARMEAVMGNMGTASRSISGRLETINEKAENITNVVTAITKVADQTNLLSLNAAIEAEKAGEYGRGFNVVAREIRRLADQTAVATLDIDRMVQEMQSAVSAGVMEMDKFIAEVNRSSKDVGRISVQLALIIEQVQALSPEFESVNVAMGRQSENAQKINQSMAALSEEVQETMDSLRETYGAIEQLNEAARGLQDEVSKFNVG